MCSHGLQPIQLKGVQEGDTAAGPPVFDPIVYAKKWPVNPAEISPNNPILNLSTTERVIDPRLTLRNHPITRIENNVDLLDFAPYDPDDPVSISPSGSGEPQLPLTATGELPNGWEQFDHDPLYFPPEDNLVNVAITTDSDVDPLPGPSTEVGQKG
jgi:hypothetical protein